jgi:uncharacterized protein with FMN-binding domain
MNTAKKVMLGVAVLGIFVIYSLGIRHQQPKITKPTSLSQNTTPASTRTPSANKPANGVARATSSGQYKDGSYSGSVTDAYYGNVQVSATISGGKIIGVKFLQYPDTHQTSVYINQQAMPYLQQEAIKAQSSQVNIVSGATFTSQAFQQSLASALSQANV